MVRAIGLDGREVEDEPIPGETIYSGQDESDMEWFDALPPWARDALRESPFTFKEFSADDAR